MTSWFKTVQYILWPWTFTYDAAKGAKKELEHQLDMEKEIEDEAPTEEDDKPTLTQTMVARKQLTYLTAGVLAITAAPAAYIAYLSTTGSKKKRGFTDRQIAQGKALENASSQATGVVMTMLAAPAIATAAAYIIVQKLEDARIIRKGLGNATQALLTVSAAGPAIQGIGGLLGTAFTKGKI